MASSLQVEELLTSYLKDVGITEEQFVLACEAGSTCNDQTKVADRVSKSCSQLTHNSVRGQVTFPDFGNLNWYNKISGTSLLIS